MCHVRIYGNQNFCSACKLTWDTDDPDPPKCLKKSGAKQIEFEAQKVPAKPKGLPEILPRDVAVEMVKVFKHYPTNQVEAMRAAYRVLLDRIEP